MLGALPEHIAGGAAEEYAGTDADGSIVRVIQQRTKLARRAIVGIAQVRLQHPHVRVYVALGVQVHRHVVVLVGVAGIAQDTLIEVFNVDPGIQLLAGVAVCTIGSGAQPHILPGNQLLDYVAAAITEIAGVVNVKRVVFRHLRRSNVQVNGGQSGVGGHIVKPRLQDLYPGIGVARVDERSRRAHRAKRTGSHHIHLLGSLGGSVLLHDANHLFGSYYYYLAAFDLFIYLLVGLRQGNRLLKSAYRPTMTGHQP